MSHTSNIRIASLSLCYSGMLRVVGLEPTAEEKRHWEALQGMVATTNISPQDMPDMAIRSSLTPKDAAAIRRITGHSIHRVTPGEASPIVTTPTGVRGAVYNKGTGRNLAIKTQLKPDLWKVAYQSIRQLSVSGFLCC